MSLNTISEAGLTRYEGREPSVGNEERDPKQGCNEAQDEVRKNVDRRCVETSPVEPEAIVDMVEGTAQLHCAHIPSSRKIAKHPAK